MAFSSTDFADDTDYERFVIGRLGTHRVRLPAPGTMYHLERDPEGGGHRRSISVEVGTATVGERGAQALRESLQPLGFAAAYKVLDMLIEHVLRANGATPGQVRRFDQKRTLLATRPVGLPTPLDRNPALWDRMAVLYTAFQDARHAVTHRRAQATPAGDLEVHNDQRQVTDTLTAAEIAAFAAAVHALAELIIEASDDARRLEIVAWHLNSLRGRHAHANLAATDPSAGRRLLKMDLIPSAQQVRMDVTAARQAIDSQPPSFWDLQLLYGAGRVFVGRWEDVPDQSASVFEFDPASPPEWLEEQVGA